MSVHPCFRVRTLRSNKRGGRQTHLGQMKAAERKRANRFARTFELGEEAKRRGITAQECLNERQVSWLGSKREAQMARRPVHFSSQVRPVIKGTDSSYNPRDFWY